MYLNKTTDTEGKLLKASVYMLKMVLFMSNKNNREGYRLLSTYLYTILFICLYKYIVIYL